MLRLLIIFGARKVPKRLQRGPGAIERVGEQVAVRLVDLLDAHEPRKLERA